MSKGVDFRKNNLIKVEHVKRVGIAVLVGCMVCGLTGCGAEEKSYESAYEKALADVKEKTDEILNEVTTKNEKEVTTIKEETTVKEELTTEEVTTEKVTEKKTKKADNQHLVGYWIRPLCSSGMLSNVHEHIQ